MAALSSLTRRAIAVYDRGYRLWHRLEGPAAEVPPVLRVQVRRSQAEHALADGLVVRRGDRVGILHLHNERVALLHVRGSPMRVGLEFRRQFFESLRTLAALAEPGGRFADVQAFGAVTIHHQALRRAGFEIERPPLALGGIVAAYQRVLLAALHPSGGARLQRLASARAERVWISRVRLLGLHRDWAASRAPADHGHPAGDAVESA